MGKAMDNLLRAFFAIAALCATSLGAAAQTYPSRPVTFVVPYAAGGGTDLLARLLAQRLERRFGRPFVVENKAGSATVIAASALAPAPPDRPTTIPPPPPPTPITSQEPPPQPHSPHHPL